MAPIVTNRDLYLAIADLTWDGFRDFLYCGQHYE